MGSLIDRLTGWLNRKSDPIFRYGGGTVVGGSMVMMEDNPEEYMKHGLLGNPDIAAIIGYIEKVAVRVPWKLMSGDKEIEKHPVIDIWEQGNPVSRGKHIFGTAIKHYLTTGNAYLRGIGPDGGMNAGRFKEFWNLYYDMAIEKDRDGTVLYYVDKRHLGKKYPATEILHWKTSSATDDQYFGTSPLKAARKVIQQSNDSYEANAKSLQNLGAKGILTRKDTEFGGPEQAKKLKEEFAREAGGADKFGKLVIAAGEYDYINFAMSPTDLQLLDAQLRSRQAICNIYGFPSELLNDKESSTYNNMQMVMKRLYTDVIIPLLEDFRELINVRWVYGWGDNLEFVPDWSKVESLQKDRRELSEWLDKAWWIPAERKSEIMGEDPTLTGHFIPMNLIPDMEDVDTEKALRAYNMEGG